MEIVGCSGSDVCRQARHPIPRQLRAVAERGRGAQRITREEAPNIDLIGGSPIEAIVAVAAKEVPLGAKIVVEAMCDI